MHPGAGGGLRHRGVPGSAPALVVDDAPAASGLSLAGAQHCDGAAAAAGRAAARPAAPVRDSASCFSFRVVAPCQRVADRSS